MRVSALTTAACPGDKRLRSSAKLATPSGVALFLSKLDKRTLCGGRFPVKRETVSNQHPSGYHPSVAEVITSRGGKKVQPRISPQMLTYLEDLVRTGFYGKTPTQVAQRLIEEGIMTAIGKQLIKVRPTE